VFLGDHGLPGYAQHNPSYEQELQLTRFHVPLLIYAPSVAAGEVRDTIASEVDVLPTIAAFTSTAHFNSTLGRDLLDTNFDGRRYAFIIDEQSKIPVISLLSRDFYFQMMADGSGKSLFRLDSPKPSVNAIAAHPAATQEMETLCRSIYETSRYMPYFNSPDRLKTRPK
jgi:membrane-anchored protein YejM (alkaline phosphatase superfamily)